MAIITVNGTATRLFYMDRGVEVTEFFTTKGGEQAQRKYTAWFEDPVSFREGASGTFSGMLSTVIEDWTDMNGAPKLNREGKQGRSVKISINGATFKPANNQPTKTAWVEDTPF